jgi:glc operon protein GlcG
MMIRKSMFALALTATLAPLHAPAQTARPMLDYATAAKMRDTCLAWAGERGLHMAIAIYDDSAKLMAFAHMDRARTGSNQLAQDKGQSAARFRIATEALGKRGMGYVPGIIVAGGGLPFFGAGGVPLGGIGVSGGTAQEDIDCGKAAAEAAGLTPAAG